MKPLYIVAVSGGVDSIVLLHQLVASKEARLIVAHVDHGMRQESRGEALFVEQLAGAYGVPFESTTLSLGTGASEEAARVARWSYLRAVSKTYGADRIVTAHHADDVVETMIINMTRGTGWRGIASLRETDEIKRPLLSIRKQQLIDYAHENQLAWREDASNRSDAYLRNRIRHAIMPRLDERQFQGFIDLYSRQCCIRDEIEQELERLRPTLRRYNYIMWPDDAAIEILRRALGALTRRELYRALHFVRTARPSKRLELSNGRSIETQVKQFIVLGRQD